MFTNPNFTGSATFQTDIILSGLISTNKSLKALLDKFDIDSFGNLVVKTNLYSVGEVTAFNSGGGVWIDFGGRYECGKKINNVFQIQILKLDF